MLAAAHGRLEPGVLAYRAAVEFTAPEVGRYQLLSTVVISDYNALGVTVGPKLKVIADGKRRPARGLRRHFIRT